MSDILCVTNRSLCGEDFLSRIEKIAKAFPAGIILREKDLTEAEYLRLASKVVKICEAYGVPCILHSFVKAAVELKADAIHLPLPALLQMNEADKAHFSVIGASCHSAEDAISAEEQGCTYITAGHIFPTRCKEGVPPRGVEFLREICKSVSVPVYAIGGINRENMQAVREAGAKGACIMSGFMCCRDVRAYLEELENEV